MRVLSFYVLSSWSDKGISFTLVLFYIFKSFYIQYSFIMELSVRDKTIKVGISIKKALIDFAFNKF
jgi:hypothetical protein